MWASYISGTIFRAYTRIPTEKTTPLSPTYTSPTRAPTDTPLAALSPDNLPIAAPEDASAGAAPTDTPPAAPYIDATPTAAAENAALGVAPADTLPAAPSADAILIAAPEDTAPTTAPVDTTLTATPTYITVPTDAATATPRKGTTPTVINLRKVTASRNIRLIS